MGTDKLIIHTFRLKPNQDLKKEIEGFVKRENIEVGWIMTCLGSLTQANLRYANQPEGTDGNGNVGVLNVVMK